MRTIPAEETKLWQLVDRAAHVRVWVSDERGTVWELSDYYGRNWVLGAEWSDVADQQLSQATIRLRRQEGALSLAPDAGGQLNRDGRGTAKSVLVEGRLVWFTTQLRPNGSGPDMDRTGFEVFRGRIDDVDLGSDESNEIKLTCRDLSCDLQDCFIEDEEPAPTGISDWYAGISWGLSVESYLQKLMDASMLSAHAPLWSAGAVRGTLYTLVRPTSRNGYLYWVNALANATPTPNTTGGTEPTWPTTPGATVVDGDVTWQCMGKIQTPATWSAGASVTAGQLVVWTDRAGTPFWYAAAVGGTTDLFAADFASYTDFGETFTDGTVTWKCMGVLPYLWTPTSPSWNLNRPNSDNGVKKEPLLGQLQRWAQSIGWNVRLAYDEASRRWRPQFSAPPATYSGTPTVSLSAGFYAVDSARRTGANVRDVVRATYGDRAAGYARKTAVSVDPAILTGADAIGHRIKFAEMTEGSSSNIDTATEAQRYADAERKQLAAPRYDVEVSMPLTPYWSVADGDTVELRPPADPMAVRYFSAAKTFAVVAVRHAVGGGKARTTLTLKEVGANNEQPTTLGFRDLARVARPGVAPAPSFNLPAACRVQVYDAAGTTSLPGSGAVTPITFDSVAEDRHGDWNGSNTFTAPFDGLYSIAGAITFPVVAAGTVLGVLAGNARNEVAVTKPSQYTVTASTTVRLSAGDTVSLQGYQNSGSAQNAVGGAAKTYLSIVKLG